MSEQIEIASAVPEWLDQYFLHKCMQRYFSDKQINIERFEIKPATGKRDNYASEVFRAKIVYSDVKSGEKVSFLCWVFPVVDLDLK